MSPSDARAARDGIAAPVVTALYSNSPYSSRLSARSALYTELRLLLEGCDEPFSRESYRVLVVEENRLSRSSTAARKKLWEELRKRYILEAAHPLYAAFWSEWTSCTSEVERGQTAYCLFALHDRLVADLGQELLFPLLLRAPAEFRVADVIAFLERSVADHPEVASWSDQTKTAVAQKYTASVRDFGLATGAIRKKTVRPAVYGPPVRLLVNALRLAGSSDLEIVQAPIFRIIGLEPTEMIDTFAELSRLGEVRFRMQGDVVELDPRRTS